MATGNYFDDQNDPLSVVQRMQQGQSAGQALSRFTFPAISQITRPNYTPFASGARPGQAAYNPINQIPIGGFSLGALAQAGYSRSPQMNIGNFLNQGAQQQPAFAGLPKTQYTLPGVGNTDVRALSDPSVGALDNATRTTNQYGQQVINPAGGGQIISGAGPSSRGALQGSTTSMNAKGQQVLNTPSGGQAIAGPSLRQPERNAYTGQVWLGGSWY